MLRRLVVMVWVAGCGDDGVTLAPDASRLDARTYDFTCADTVAPVTAPDPAPIGGSLVDLTETQTLPNIGIAVHRASDDAVLASTTTNTNGRYQVSIATGGAAVEIYRKVTAIGYPTTRVYGPRIVSSAANTLDNVVITASERDAGAAAFGITADPQHGSIITVIRDCANTPVVGASIAVSPVIATTGVGYYDGGVATPANTVTGSDGFAVAWNVPAGPATVTITYGTSSWRMRPVTVDADGVVLSFREP